MRMLAQSTVIQLPNSMYCMHNENIQTTHMHAYNFSDSVTIYKRGFCYYRYAVVCW